MAKFVFRMQGILSVKYKLEDQAKAEYGVEVRKLVEEEEKLKAMLLRKEAYQARLTKAVQDALDIRKIKMLEDSIEHVKYEINVQKFVIQRQQKRVDQAREKLDEAMKERKTYEKLKEKAFEQFKLEVAAEERKEVDELVSFRFSSQRESEEV